MLIQITGGGIYASDGSEIPVGTELSLKAEPTAWAGRYVVLSDDAGKTPVVNPAADALLAKHRGGGSYSVMKGDEEVLDKLTRDQAEAFNALSADDQALAIEYAKAEREAA